MQGTLRFVPRLNIVQESGTVQLRFTYKLGSKRIFVNSGISIFAIQWDAKQQQLIYLNKKEAKKLAPDLDYDKLPGMRDVGLLNDSLAGIRAKIRSIEDYYLANNIPFSCEMVIDEFKKRNESITKTEEPSNLVFEFIDRYVADNSKSRAKGSLKVYSQLKRHLEGYQNKKRVKITFDKIDYSFFLSFNNYLIDYKFVHPKTKNVRTLNNITIAKQLSTLKTFLGYARMNGLKINDSYKDFTVKRQKLEVIALTEPELMRIINLDLSENKKLDQVRDVFVFSATTGMRYSDMLQLRREHIKPTEIRFTVTKTKTHLRIPLNKYSDGILKKYGNHEKPLPVISNQKTNDYLKEVCKLAEINDPVEIIRFRGAEELRNVYPKWELVGIHQGRKTFASLSLERGISAEEVMKLGSWSDWKSFSRYVKITEERKRESMTKAWGAPEIMKVVGGAE